MSTAFVTSLLWLLLSSPSSAQERVTFERQGQNIKARLVPLAKTTSISITFSCEGGELLSVEEFKGPTEGLEINPRDLRSGLFAVKIRTEPGSVARLDLASEYFTSSTVLLEFNPRLKKYWLPEPDPHLKRAAPQSRNFNLRVMARDGSELDIDGLENGVIELVTGPRDSFWGYALGTLFIRFFGIFIVLGILMGGMMLAGKSFSAWARRRASGEDAGPQPQVSPDGDLLPEQVAALAVALHLQQQQQKPAPPASTSPPGGKWAQAGRLQLMRGVGFTRRPTGKE